MGARTGRLVTELGMRTQPARGLLLLTWTVLAGLVVAHVGYRTFRVPADPGYGLGRDRGFADVYFTVLVLWVVVMCLVLAWRWRSVLLGVWALAFGVLVADDWLSWHERFGVVIAHRLGTTAAVGELVWLGTIGLVLGTALLVAHARSRGTARATSTMLLLLCAGLFGCGVVVDALHVPIDDFHVNTVALVLEDGGEIAVACLLVSFLFAVAYGGHRPTLVDRFVRTANPQDVRR
jgi:hypothetical protein